MRGTELVGRVVGLVALVLCVATTTESATTAILAVAFAAALLVAVGSRVVVARRIGGVGLLRGEVPVQVPVLSSRIADPDRQPVRPRAPGLV